MVEVSLPHTKYAVPVYYIIVPSEDSSNMARYDAIRYGVPADNVNSLMEHYSVSRAQGMPEEVKRRVMIGAYCLSAGYYDQYYRKAQKVRTLIIRDFNDVFTKVDALLTPTSPFPAFELGEKKDDVMAMYLADVFAAPAALAGIPALSVSAGMTTEKLPVGVQIMGPRMGEGITMRIAQKIEKYALEQQ